MRAREEVARDLGKKLVVAARILAKKQGGLTGPVAAPHVCAIGGGRARFAQVCVTNNERYFAEDGYA